MRVFRRIMLSGLIDPPSETQKLYYTATAKVVPASDNSLGSTIISNKWDSSTNEGIIVCRADITTIGSGAFRNCKSLTSITIPDSVTEIGKEVFYFCSNLTSVTIGNSVTSIGYYAFEDCTSLKRVDITDLSAWCKISFVGREANPLSQRAKLYLNGSELTDITIPSDITEIKAYAFRNCTSLTSVTIPDSVTAIGYNAFESCSSLTSVYCKPTAPPLFASAIFHNNDSGRIIYVPTGSVDTYKSATNWSEYADSIVGYDF